MEQGSGCPRRHGMTAQCSDNSIRGLGRRSARVRVRGAREDSAPRAVIANQSRSNCWMDAVERELDHDEDKSELFGNLSLVGSGGRFVAVLTKRQLTLERFDGHGIRLSLGSISRMRHMKVPMLPDGTIPLGLLAIYLGLGVMLPPYAMVATAAGALTLLGYLVSRTSVLAIETEAGDRHIVSGSEGVLLRLCLMVDRVRHGNSIEEARIGLEHIDAELPSYPAYRDAGGSLPEPKGLLTAPEDDLVMSGLEEELMSFDFDAPAPPITPEMPATTAEPLLSWEAEEPVAPAPTYSPSYQLQPPQEPVRSSYESAWNREAPSWYTEKPAAGSRIDSAGEDAAGAMDLFGEGGIFDAEPTSSYSPPTASEPYSAPTHDPPTYTAPGTYIQATGPPPTERSPTSSEMIRRAHDRFGPPEGPYSEPSLPAPTEAAVREDCRPGIVRQARAKQALLSQGEVSQPPVLDAASLEEFPGISKLANSMSTGRIKSNRRSIQKSAPSWIEVLLRPTARPDRGRSRSYASEYGDGDGEVASSDAHFQSSQHMRLRSDQEHQADVAAHGREVGEMQSHSARDALSEVVNRVSTGEERGATDLRHSGSGLRFSQLRRTSSKGDPHPLPGIRRLE